MNYAVDPNAIVKLNAMKQKSLYSPALVQKLIELAIDGQIDPQTVLTMKSITDFVLYTKKLITALGSGIYQILLQSDTSTNGLRNINNAQLPKGNNFIFDEIHLKWAYILSTATAICNVPYSGYTQEVQWVTASTVGTVNPWAGAQINPALFNAEFEIKSGGNVLVNIPVSEIIKEAGGAGIENTSAGKYKLVIPKLIKELEIVEFNLKYGSGTLTAIAEDTYIMVALKGLMTSVS